MGEDGGRRPLDRVKDAVAAVLGRRSENQVPDDETRQKLDELAESRGPDVPPRTTGMIYRPENTSDR